MLITKRLNLRTLLGASVVLWYFVDRKVADVGIGLELGLEGGLDSSKLIPYYATKEGVGFDFLCAIGAMVAAKTVLNVAEHAVVTA